MRPLYRPLSVSLGLAVLLVAGGAPAQAQPAAPIATPVVQAFPSPGSRTVSPGSQISFRGTSTLPPVEVRGSVTGPHPGQLLPHSDHAGVSFVPTRPFAPGETVTVRTPMDVAGSSGGTFTYAVARPVAVAPRVPLTSPEPTGPVVPRPAATTAGPYRSRPDLRPPVITTTSTGPHAPGLLFASSGIPTPTVDTGVMIYDDRGEPVWFNTLPDTGLGTLQRIPYEGRDALTWFTGTQAFQGGFKGTWTVADSSYTQIGEIAAGNGLTADGHELRVSADGTKALLAIYNPVEKDMTEYGGQADATVYEAVVQEIDLGTGAVTFEWHSLDESPVTDSFEPLTGATVDYFHVNALEYDNDGGILVSGRHVSQVLKLDRNAATGKRVQWRLGGRHSTFALQPGDAPSYPHDVRRRPDGTLSVYDNAVRSTRQGRGIAYRLDSTAGTATVVQTWNHNPEVFGLIVGSNRLLGNGDELVSYGSTGIATEYDPAGEKVWESTFGGGSWSYRTLRVDGWHARPAEPPALVTDRSGTSVTGYASWNGSTDVAAWVLLAGPSVDRLRKVGPVTPRRGFETTLTGTVTSQDTVFVAEARDAAGALLRRSTGSDTATAIQAHYNSLGGPASLLGPATSAEIPLADGAYARYENGVIYYSPATQAWEVHGGILAAWSALGAERSVVGYPITDERGLPDGVGRFNLFGKGAIYWTPQTGGHEVHGLIGNRWSGLGSQSSFLGYPVTDELGLPDGHGRVSVFQGGSVYYAPGVGTFEVHGAIRDRWQAVGAQGGVLGYPASDETAVGDGIGRVSRFQHGSVHWSAPTGAFEVHGAIATRFAADGEERGVLGYPLTNETATRDGVGRFNAFQGGSIYFSPATGAWAAYGAIGQKWASLGAEMSLLGYPTGDETGTADGVGRYSTFQYGVTYWTPRTGAHEVNGTILASWRALGADQSRLGYPVSDEYAVPGGRRSDFQHGSLIWDATTGVVTVLG